MKTTLDIFELQKMSLLVTYHTFFKVRHELFKKTTLALRGLCLFVFLLAFQQTVAQTPQYHNQDNIIAQRFDGRGGIIKGADGIFYVWGWGAYQKGNPNYNKYKSNYNSGAIASQGVAEFLEPLTAANGFGFTGNILKATMVGSSMLSGTYINTDRLILTDNDKLWFIPCGDDTYSAGDNFGITVTSPTGTHTSSQVMEAKLPVGVTAAQVSYLNGGSANDYPSYGSRSIYLIANGNVYIASDHTESASGAVAKVVDANGWEKVMVSAGVALSNVKWVSEYKSSYFAAYTTNDEIYIWGGSSNGSTRPGYKNQTGGYPNTGEELFLPVGATWNNYYANKAKNPPVPFTMFNVGYHYISGLGTDGVLYHVGQVHYGRKASRTVYPTWQYASSGTLYFNVGLNPSTWQQLFFDNDPGFPNYAKWTGHNEIWRAQYYFDGTTVNDMKFYQTVEELGDLGIRNDLDHHVMYYNRVNMNTGSSMGGQSYAPGTFGASTFGIESNWTFATSDTRLAYIANSKVMPNYPNWGLTHDGSVCVTGHTGRGANGYETTGDAGLDAMGIFYRKDNVYSYQGQVGGIPQGGWKCGKPIKAGGGTFVPAGAITTPVVPPTSTPGVGTIDCNKTQLMPAPVFGTASQTVLMVTINVTTAGTFTPTVSGSGMSLVNSAYTVTTTTTGVQTFAIPLKYDGTTALGTLSFTISPAGICTADLTKSPKNAITPIWTLECIPSVGPGLK